MGGKAKAQKQPSAAAPMRRPDFQAVVKSWAGAKDVFFPLRLTKRSQDIKRIEEVLQPLMPLAELRLALGLVLLSGVLLFLIALSTTLVSLQLANFASDALTQVTGVAQQGLTLANLAPVAAFQFVLYVPLNLAITLIYEGLAFGIIRLTGGKGTFAQQLYLSSVAGLSMSFASVLSLFAPLPCIQVVAGIALVLLTLYILLFVIPKAYTLVHGIGFNHAFAITIILTILKLVALALITNVLAVAMGFPAPISYPGGY